LHAALLQTPSGLKHVNQKLQSVALLSFAPSAPVVAAVHEPLTHEFGFRHSKKALQVQTAHLVAIVSMLKIRVRESGRTPNYMLL
jgi:hypothetical protein